MADVDYNWFQEKLDLQWEAVKAIEKERDELVIERNRLRNALHHLIQLKTWKEKYGKDDHYNTYQPIAWTNAKNLLS